MRNNMDRYIEELCSYLVSIDSEDDCRNFLDDLCTRKEIEQMALRAHAAGLLMAGSTYTEAIEATGLSSTTLSRISRCISYGAGGYTKTIGKADDET
ncbi:MAG: YerC/YecD family TrpR-related protein [Clostridia bacterium]|nr:YerC/YecD family TrpR-related protein [Clostridia bacterium]